MGQENTPKLCEKSTDLNPSPTCISGSIPVLNAITRLADAPIVVKILLVVVPGML
jgi:hypothetical protein